MTQPHVVLTTLLLLLVAAPAGAQDAAPAEAPATAAAPAPTVAAPTALAAPVEAAAQGAETPTVAGSETPVEPAVDAPKDAAWDAFLATLPDEATGAAGGDGALTERVSDTVGKSTTDLGRAGGALLLSALAMAVLLAIPSTRRRLLGRLLQRPPTTDEALAIDIRATRAIGAGQRVVALEVDGVRLLVGVSQGRMDVLHTWWNGAAPTAMPVPAAAPRAKAASVVQQVLAERAQTPPAPAPAPAPAAEATPSSRELVGAWTRSAPKQTEAPAAPADELPWWMEGATAAEAESFRATAAEDSATDDVIRRVRARKAKAASKPNRKPAPAVEERPLAATGTDGLRKATRFVLLLALTVLLPTLFGFDVAEAADPALRFEVGGGEDGGSPAIRLLATLTLLAVAPAMVLAMTSFTRLIVVFSLLRQAVGVQQAPPNQVLIGLALFLTWFIMGPTFTQVHDQALSPWMDGQITEGQALDEAMGPMRQFMFKNTREQDLALFLRLDKSPRPETRSDVPARVLVPAFLISELKTAFTIGFLLYIPFLVIDIVVATVLLAMGMMVLPPVVISLPFKLLLFVFVDGWNLLVGSLVTSFA